MEMTKVNNWLNNVQEWLWPQHCRLCGEGPLAIDATFCAGCLGDLPWNTASCEVCALPLPQLSICGTCQAKPPPYHRALATFRYAEPLAHIVHGLKFGQRLYYGRFLGAQLAATVAAAEEVILPDVMLPVPLHWKRMRERGYNQALEIARPVAHRFKLPIIANGVVRARATTEQSQLNAKERRQNLAKAFTVNADVAGLHIAIVDDVMTTGATVGELTRVLISAGARRVDIWLAARAALSH